MTGPSGPTGPDAWGPEVCTIRSPRLARGILASLIVLGVASSLWLVAAILSGPWLADTLLVEGAVAGVATLAAVLIAFSLSRALGCGHCHTPQCTCS